MSTVFYALISVVCTAVLRIAFRHCLVGNERAWATLIIYNFGALAVLLPFLGVPDLTQLQSHQIALLVGSGVLFSIAGILDVLAIKKIDASSGEIFHTLGFIISVSAGVLFFHESCSLQKIFGAVIIIAGILAEARRARVSSAQGMLYKLGSSACTAAAIVITKQLTNDTPAAVIILTGFFIPGVIYLALGLRDVPAIIPTIFTSKGVVLIIPVLEAIAYSASVTAFASGEMSTAYIVFQTTITAVLLLEVLVYGWQKEVHFNRALSAGLCVTGAIIAIAG